MKPWQEKAHRLITAMCQASYEAAQTRKDGTRYRKHRAYSVPAVAQVLVACLARDDEEGAKAVFVAEEALAQEYKE